MSDPKRPGRPPLVDDDRTMPVTVRVLSKDFDRLCERAQRERVNVQDLLRAGIARIAADEA